ncbi:MAG: NAD(P)-dependent oxidoreductase [Actinobacteria bacterium]|nr:NAD(P)-dependent oxidoreductase [Actinomycetota bacterium]
MTTTPRDDRRALVTGGTGFLGSHLVAELLARGWRVRTCGRRTRPPGVPSAAEYVCAELGSDAPLDRVVRDVTHVFHLAGLSSSIATEEEMRRTNVDGTRQLLDAAAGEDVERVVHVSTSSVYGSSVQLPLPVPEDADKHPSPGYGQSKWEAEKIAFAIAEDRGLPVAVLRPTTVYGPGAVKLLASTILDAAVERFAGLDTFAVDSDEIELRMVHVDDLVGACLHLAEHPTAATGAYNLSGSYPTNHQVGEVIAEELGMKLDGTDDPERGLAYEKRAAVRERMLERGMVDGIMLKEKRVRFLKKSNPNNRLSLEALAATGFEPHVTDVPGSVASTVRWYRDVRWII